MTTRRPAGGAVSATLLVAVAAACSSTHVGARPPAAGVQPSRTPGVPPATASSGPRVGASGPVSPTVPAAGALPQLGPPGDQPRGLAFPRPPVGGFAALQVPPGRGATVSLTFDDGPDVGTDTIRRLLLGNRAPAVFCVVGQQAQQFPGALRRLVHDGFVLCDHSRDHDPAMLRRGSAFLRDDVSGGLADIRSVVAAPVPFYRQPYGDWSPAVVREVRRLRLRPLRWSDDPRDWSRPGAVVIAQRVLLRLQPGAVVLLHDGGGDSSQTAAALRWLLPALRAAGWRFSVADPPQLSDAAAAVPQ